MSSEPSRSEILQMFHDPKNPNKTDRIDIRVPSRLKEALDELAARDGDKVADLVRWTLMLVVYRAVKDRGIKLSFLSRE